MEDINKIIGKNLLALRKRAKLTQAELADIFNYSDKSVSKWETGESLPSIDVICDLAKFYEVSLDDLTSETDILLSKKQNESEEKHSAPAKFIISLLSVSAVWLAMTVLFVCLKIFAGMNYFMCFLWAVPLSCIVFVVFNAIWGKSKYLFYILTILIWSSLVSFHLQVIVSANLNIWPIYIIGAPLQVAVILWAALVKKRPRK